MLVSNQLIKTTMVMALYALWYETKNKNAVVHITNPTNKDIIHGRTETGILHFNYGFYSVAINKMEIVKNRLHALGNDTICTVGNDSWSYCEFYDGVSVVEVPPVFEYGVLTVKVTDNVTECCLSGVDVLRITNGEDIFHIEFLI